MPDREQIQREIDRLKAEARWNADRDCDIEAYYLGEKARKLQEQLDSPERRSLADRVRGLLGGG